MRTSAGDLIIDLFARECPLAVRNFCQLCVDGAYDGAPFHRIVPATLVQAGYESRDVSSFERGGAFRDEFHSRLEFRGRGIVAMANEGKPNTNRSQFFITLKPCPWLNRKHTIFGIVRGDPVFTAVKIGDSPQENERALQPYTILSATIIEQPFAGEDIARKQGEKAQVDESSSTKAQNNEISSKPKSKGVTTLSFMDDEEEEMIKITKKTPHALKRASKKEGDVSTVKKSKVQSSRSSSSSSSSGEENDSGSEDDRGGEKNETGLAQEQARDSRLADKLATFKAKRNL